MLVAAISSPAFRNITAELNRGENRIASPFIHKSVKKTKDDPMPRTIIIWPTGIVSLAILISKSANVKQPIAIIIKIMLLRFALVVALEICFSMKSPMEMSFSRSD